MQEMRLKNYSERTIITYISLVMNTYFNVFTLIFNINKQQVSYSSTKSIYRIPIDFTIRGSVQLSFMQNSAYHF